MSIKTRIIFLILALTVSCEESNTGTNNGGKLNNGKTNNGQTTNNGSNNGQTVNNGLTSNNGTTSNNNITNNGTKGTTAGTTDPLVRVPVKHRALATCDDVRPVGDGAESGDCVVDADCIEGANGRCNPGRVGGACSYDDCFSDSDCPNDEACACEGEENTYFGNRCLGGNCQIDADCGRNGFCSPTLGSCGNYSPDVAYFCHTPEDECIDDSDCADFKGEGGSGTPYCKFSTEVERWVCDNSQCVG